MYRVMLADDEPIVRKALQTLIDWKRLGCEVVLWHPTEEKSWNIWKRKRRIFL